ncbi:MAG: thiamine pyrophosphate-binding protein [Nitrospinota bacterium]
MSDGTAKYKEIIRGLKDWGAKMVVYVPDRWIGPLCRAVEADPDLIAVNACREEEGVAVCVGALATGTKAVMVLQNAGFLSSGSGINLAKMYQVPLLFLISYRGNPEESLHYHVLKGVATEPVLKSFNIGYRLPAPDRDLAEQVVEAGRFAEASSHPFALLLRKGDLA